MTVDLEHISAAELLARLRNGQLDTEEPELVETIRKAVTGARRGRGRPPSALPYQHMKWGDQEFTQKIMFAVREQLGYDMYPPQIGETASILGVDRKTIRHHLDVHLGIKTWKEFQRRLGLLGLSKT